MVVIINLWWLLVPGFYSWGDETRRAQKDGMGKAIFDGAAEYCLIGSSCFSKFSVDFTGWEQIISKTGYKMIEEIVLYSFFFFHPKFVSE